MSLLSVKRRIITSQANKPKVFIMTGQSNMAGPAANSDATSAEIAEHPKAHIFQENDAFAALNISAGNNYELVANTTHGLELSLSELLPDDFYMIKWAVGSTSIDEQLSGGSVYTRLYNNFYTPAIAELGDLDNYDVYVVFWQGEEDALTQAAADAYAAKFDTWVNLWKTNLGSNVKFRIMEISNLARPYAPQINDVFAAKAAIEPNMIVIESGDLYPGYLHYAYAPMKQAGQLLVNSL